MTIVIIVAIYFIGYAFSLIFFASGSGREEFHAVELIELAVWPLWWLMVIAWLLQVRRLSD